MLTIMKQILDKLTQPVLGIPRNTKRLLVFSTDLSLCVLSVWLAYYLRLGEFINISSDSVWGRGSLWAAGASIGLALPLFMIFGLYRAIFRYSGWPALTAVARAICLYGLLYAAIFIAIGVDGVPRTIAIIQPILLLLLVGGSRAFARLWLGEQYQSILQKAKRSNVLVYGAGTTGRQLVASLASSHELKVVGFLDDDNRLHGNALNGKPIYNPLDLDRLARSLDITTVLLAMPNLSRTRRNLILNKIRGSHVVVRTLPNLNDLAQGKVGASNLQELDVEDLLGRDPVAPDHNLLSMNIQGKVVMVTGAGGSIGSELCRQICKLKPEKLILVDVSEFALYVIHSELRGIYYASEEQVPQRLVPLLASVNDEERIRAIMETYLPETVYHAAAYKHVPLVEHNLAEGVNNNVMGTLTMALLAIEYGVRNFVLISTDKAVRPTNIMGASKRLAELSLQALWAEQINKSHHSGSKSQHEPRTRLSMVRFGNVLDSSGSVIPKFRQQIRNGGPITLTHPEITRYFMTITEAAQLVIQAGAMAKGGDVFVLDMGTPVRIADLARLMVELSGLSIRDASNPSGDIEIMITGLRPGEKLYEELMLGDNPEPTIQPKIQRAQDPFIPWSELEGHLENLKFLRKHNDVERISGIVQNLVIGYLPNGNIVDWVYNERMQKSCSAYHQRRIKK
ncbi:MAG: nucleoside-diphosphate sugar epimerase/dehydratase [Betaproteobacteria bacterium]